MDETQQWPSKPVWPHASRSEIVMFNIQPDT